MNSFVVKRLVIFANTHSSILPTSTARTTSLPKNFAVKMMRRVLVEQGLPCMSLDAHSLDHRAATLPVQHGALPHAATPPAAAAIFPNQVPAHVAQMTSSSSIARHPVRSGKSSSFYFNDSTDAVHVVRGEPLLVNEALQKRGEQLLTIGIVCGVVGGGIYMVLNSLGFLGEDDEAERKKKRRKKKSK